MLELTTSGKKHWCNKCGRMIPKNYQFWAGTKVTMVGIIPLTEYIREHTDCKKFADQPIKDRVIPSEE